MAWERLSWNPKSETIEDFTDRVKQLGDMLDKNEQEQVRTIKVSTPDRGTYQAIMRCDTIDEIVETINQLEGFPLIHNPTEATNSLMIPFMTAQQRDKAVKFANDCLFLDSMAELGEQIGSKIDSKFSDRMSELANNTDRLSVRVKDYKKSPRNSRMDYSEDRDRYRGRSNSRNRSNSRGCMIKIDIEGDLKTDMIGLIQEKGLIGMNQNTDLTLETDIEGMTDIEMMKDIEGMTDIEMMTDIEGMTDIEMMIDKEEMINLTKKARYGVTPVNLWAIIH